MTPASQAPVNPGDTVAGKYRVERVLGQGGMGVVVEATHQDLDERVALKFLLPGALRPDAIERFLREARAAVKIKSEHVARVLDVGKLDAGAPYIVMEFLHGSDLSAVLEQRGRVAAEEAVDWVLQACEALAEAHAMGIVHRDLKPHNLFLTTRPGGAPLIKVLDFGVAKTLSPDSQTSLTQTSQSIGSPLYMSPEQVRSSKHVDQRSDIWALGVILYQLLSGQPPFLADTAHALCAAITADEPAPPRDRCPGLPAALSDAILRCLEKSPERRFATVAELALALEPFGGPGAAARVAQISSVSAARSSLPSLASTPRPAPTPSQQTIDPLASSRPAPPPPEALAPPAPSPQPHALWALALVAAGTLGLLGWLALRPVQPPSPVAPLPASAPAACAEPSAPVAPSAPASAPTAAASTPAPQAPSASTARPSPAPRPPALLTAPAPTRDRTTDTRR